MRVLDIDSSSMGCGGRSAPAATPIRDAQRTALPPRFGFVDTEQASGLVPSRGLYRCGTVPGFHRSSLESAPLRVTGATATLADRAHPVVWRRAGRAGAPVSYHAGVTPGPGGDEGQRAITLEEIEDAVVDGDSPISTGHGGIGPAAPHVPDRVLRRLRLQHRLLDAERRPRCLRLQHDALEHVRRGDHFRPARPGARTGPVGRPAGRQGRPQEVPHRALRRAAGVLLGRGAGRAGPLAVPCPPGGHGGHGRRGQRPVRPDLLRHPPGAGRARRHARAPSPSTRPR